MAKLRDIPAGSQIEVRSELEGTVIVLPLSGVGRAGRWGVAAFLSFWLCGWAVGEVAAITAVIGIVRGTGPGRGAAGVGAVFLLAWLGGWTIGGAAAMWALAQLVRKPRSERITLGMQGCHYDPGHTPPVQNQFELSQQRRGNPFKFGGKRRAIDLRRAEVKAFVLDRVGERQRLYFDHGAERIEIGAGLSEPEREWLFDVLEQWRQ